MNATPGKWSFMVLVEISQFLLDLFTGGRTRTLGMDFAPKMRFASARS